MIWAGRYTLYTVGSIVIVFAALRFFVFRLPESPYFLWSSGREAEALKVVEFIAKKSNKLCHLTLDQLKEVNDRYGRRTETSTVQYAYTPESFVSTIRATANGPCSIIGCVFGMAAPITSSQIGVSTNFPIYVNGALILATGVLILGLPMETVTPTRFRRSPFISSSKTLQQLPDFCDCGEGFE